MAATNGTGPGAALVPRESAAADLERAGFVRLATLEQAMRFAEFIGKSQLVPDAYRGKPADIVISMQLGMELGIPPLQALQSIAVINGKPSLYGDAVKGLIVGRADCVDFVDEEPSGETVDQWVAQCVITRRGRTPVVRTFSWADAKRAGLTGKKGPWQEYPRRMLMARARGFAVRDAYPDVLRGITTVEEAGDYPSPAPMISEPRRVGAGASTSTAPPAETTPASDPAPTSASPATTPAGTGSPSSRGAVDQQAVGTILEAAHVVDQGTPHYVIRTSAGVFVTRDQTLYTAASTLAGTDHVCQLSYRHGKRASGDEALVLLALEVEESAAPQGREPGSDDGDEGGAA